MNITPNWASHNTLLVKCLSLTSGDVLEMGAGPFSTPLLHWLTYPYKRKLVTYENNDRYFNGFVTFKNEYHDVIKVEDWDKAEIEKEWDVALIDHKPPERRKVDIARLANYVKYLVVHDTLWKGEHNYHYKEIYPLFKYRYDFKFKSQTTVLSNFVDVTNIL